MLNLGCLEYCNTMDTHVEREGGFIFISSVSVWWTGSWMGSKRVDGFFGRSSGNTTGNWVYLGADLS